MNRKAGVTPVYLMLYKFKHSITYVWEVSRWVDGICKHLGNCSGSYVLQWCESHRIVMVVILLVI